MLWLDWVILVMMMTQCARLRRGHVKLTLGWQEQVMGLQAQETGWQLGWGWGLALGLVKERTAASTDKRCRRSKVINHCTVMSER
jgi:hypothetical protein